MPTSKLQREARFLISTYFSQYEIKENYRPEWLLSPEGTRLELDFYIKELEIAIEVQGKQHFVYDPYYHGDHEGFKKRLLYDRIKREKCATRNITLWEVCTKKDVLNFIERFATSEYTNRNPADYSTPPKKPFTTRQRRSYMGKLRARQKLMGII